MLFYEDWMKWIGKLLILVSIGMQAYVLSAESNLVNQLAEYQAKKTHYQFMQELVEDKLGENVFTKPIIEKRTKQLQQLERDWSKQFKKRSKQIVWLSSLSFWAIIIFGSGTLILTVGEFLSFRKDRLKKQP